MSSTRLNDAAPRPPAGPAHASPGQSRVDRVVHEGAHLRHPWLLDLPTEPTLGPRGMDYLERALRALAPAPLPDSTRLEIIELLNGLVTLFARTELRRQGSPTDPGRAHASYLATAATEERHPHIVAALATGFGDEVSPDTHALFERMVRRVLTGLIETPDTSA